MVPLQKFCRVKIKNYNCIRRFLKTLGSIEEKRVLAEREFHQTLELWNKPLTQPHHPPLQPLTQPVTAGNHHTQI